jgi:hypothetical protein
MWPKCIQPGVNQQTLSHAARFTRHVRESPAVDARSGVSARYSGYDISGQKVLRVTPAMAMEYRAQGDGDLACERCGFVAPAKRRN